LVLIIIVLIIIAYFFVMKSSTTQKGSVNQTIAVQIQKPKVMQLAQNITVVGSIYAPKQTFITPQNNGYITKILFKEGQFVKANAPLIILDSTKLKAQLAADESAELTSQHQYVADKKLAKKGYAAIQDLEQARSDYQAKASAVTQDKKLLSENTLRAPFSGYLGSKTISVGNYVTAAQQLVEIVDRDHLRVKYGIPETDADNIQLGQTITIKNPYLRKDIFKASINYIAPAINTDTRTISVHANIDNTKHLLTPGQFVSVIQPLSHPESALFIPEDALLRSIDGFYVYTLKNNHAIQTKVKPGIHQKGFVQIMMGLTANSDVITQGQFQLKNNQAVKLPSKKITNNKKEK